MASANHQEASAVAGHGLVSQRQQQELIKLLTQHFHQQFYQLATNSANNTPPAATSTTDNTSRPNNTNGSRLLASCAASNHLFQHQAAAMANYQQQIAHYANHEHPVIGPGSACDLSSGMNLLAPSVNHNLLNNALNRSQHSTSGTNANLMAPATAENLVDFTMRQGLNPYSSINDLNFFDALGLNLTSNQLVLSLQQQQHHHHHHQQQQQQALINAAAARQCEVRNDIDEIESRQASGRRNSSETLNNLTDQEDNHTSDGKEMLKFSINTILGRGSPDIAAGMDDRSAQSMIKTNLTSRAQNMSASVKSFIGSSGGGGHAAADSKLFNSVLDSTISEQNERQRRQGRIGQAGDDCDHLIENDSGSESSEMDTPRTPTMSQTSSSSILYGNNSNNQQSHSSKNHRSAVNLAKTTGQPHHLLIANNQQPLHQHHPQAHQHQSVNSQQHPPLTFLANSTAFPWTVAARGKPRRGMMRRAVFSDSQRVGLEKRFQLQKYISKPDRKKLAEKLGLRDSQVKIWFQNRRMKWRNSKERELLSAGGSREQTLPTRNNPNPDLSDVGETIKRLATDSSPTDNSSLHS